jgi:DnaJ-class molecular chaperone
MSEEQKLPCPSCEGNGSTFGATMLGDEVPCYECSGRGYIYGSTPTLTGEVAESNALHEQVIVKLRK